jgi:hypothetical protein
MRFDLTDLDNIAGFSDSGYASNLLAVGEAAIPRWNAIGSSGTLVSGTLYLTFWQCRKAQPTAKVRFRTSGSAAAATPTLVQAGVYTVTPRTGDLVLGPSSSNDVTKLAAANTAYDFVMTTTPTRTRGAWYATGLLVISAAAMPTCLGINAVSAFGVSMAEPRMAAAVSGQTSLPATVSAASLSAASPLVIIQSAVLPA